MVYSSVSFNQYKVMYPESKGRSERSFMILAL